MATTPQPNPWLDENTQLGDYSSSYFEDITKINEEQSPQEVVPDDPGEPKPAEEPPAAEVPPPAEPVAEPVEEPAEQQPRITSFEDGSSLTVSKEKGQWKAILDTNIQGVNPETFYGKTKDELYTRIAAGKVNATKKIRELNRVAKLGSNNPPPAPKPNVSSKATVRDLTPEEVFEFKTLYDSNPVAALDFYNEKRYGLKPQEFVRKLNEGTTARQLGDIESVARTFVNTNPDYYPSKVNFYTVVKYLVRKYFGRGLAADEDYDQLTVDLLENGAWTVENLESAKEDLLLSELLEVAPKAAPTPTPAPKPAETPAAAIPPPAEPASEPARIAPQPAVRTRAGNLGIRTQETSRVPVEPEKPPTDEDVNNWDDGAVEAALKQFRLNKQKQR